MSERELGKQPVGLGELEGGTATGITALVFAGVLDVVIAGGAPLVQLLPLWTKFLLHPASSQESASCLDITS